MKIALFFIIVIFMFLFLAGTSITLHPFAIKFKSLSVAFGYLFLLISLLCFRYHWIEEGEQQVYDRIEEVLTGKN